MKCSYCKEEADFKCACQEPFMCTSHLGLHLKTKKSHNYESFDEELGGLRINRLRSKLIKRIQKVKIFKNELVSNTESLIKSIKSALKQVSGQLDAIINTYVELLNRFKFCGSEMQAIVDIESLDINFRTIGIDGIKGVVQYAYSMDLFTYEKIEKNGENEFLNQHSGGFLCGAITKDCQTLVTGGLDSVIRVWDLNQKQQKFVLLGHNSNINCIVLTGDEQYIISGSLDASVRVWNIKQMSQISLLKGHKNSVQGISYAENHSLIISGDYYCEVIVWDFTKSEILKKVSFLGAIYTLILIETQSCIIFGEGKNIAFVELETLKKQKSLEGHSRTVLSLALSSDETIMVSGSWDQSIIVWDLIESNIIAQLIGHNGPVRSLSLTLDDQFIVSGSDDKYVRVWEMTDFSQVLNYNHSSLVNMILRANQDFYSLSADSCIGRLDMTSGKFEVNQFLKPFKYVPVNFSNESRLIGYGSQNEAKVWDLERGIDICVMSGHQNDVQSVEVSRDGQFALTCSLGEKMNLIYWDLFSNKKIGELNGHKDSVFCASFSSDDLTAASGSYDGTVRVWNLKELKQKSEFLGHTDSIYSIKFIDTKKLLVSGGADEKVMVWNLIDNTQYAALSGHNDIIWKILITNDEQFIVSGDLVDGIIIWNFKKKQKSFSFSFQEQASSWLEKNGIKLISLSRYLKA